MSFVRELGAAERIYCREQTDYGNQTLVQAFVLSNTKRIVESTAREYLKKLYKSFCPILGYELQPSDDQTTLVYKSKDERKAEYDLMSNFRYEQNVDWHEIFQNEFNTPFNNDNLSRWIIVDGYILIISIHHALVDAKNFFYIAREYISLCLSLTNEMKENVHLEPMEKYLFNRYTYEPISDLDIKTKLIRPYPIVSETHVAHSFISNSIIDRLKNQCHSRHIRLNSILTVITSYAYYLAQNLIEEKKLKIHMMVNIRPQLELDFEKIGMFVTVFDCLIDLKNETMSTLWLKAIEQHHDLHNRITNKEYINNCKNDSDLLKMINNNESFSSDDVDFAFSNLGLLLNTDNNQIGEHYFGVSLVEQRWTSSILVGVSTIHNNLCFTITYNKNKVEKHFIDQWIEKINFLLQQV